MKRFLFLLIGLGLFACNQNLNDDVLPQKKKYRDLRVVYSTELCCGNLMLLDEVRIYSQDKGYIYFALAAVNIDELGPDLQVGDTLTVDFSYTDESFYCEIICNAPLGIPVKLEDW